MTTQQPTPGQFHARFSDRLGKVREARGLTHKELSARLRTKLSARTLVEVEKRERELTLIQAIDLCQVLQVSIDDMVNAEHLFIRKRID